MSRCVAVWLVGLVASLSGGLRAEHPAPLRDVVYGHKAGMGLVMDVLPAEKPSGVGVLFMISGGFSSHRSMIDSGFIGLPALKDLLDRGHTVFLVCHGSQPQFVTREIVDDIHRAVRYIKSQADRFHIDPQRLAIMGASSGGYLTLAVATGAREGKPDAADPVERQSSRVAVAAAFFPPTDLVDYGEKGRLAVEFEPVRFVWHCFEVVGKPREEQIEILRRLSPLHAITPDDAPTLLITGDMDPLVPHEQSERFIAQLQAAKIDAKLVMRPGAAHGWPDLPNDFALMADWFDSHLTKPDPSAPASR